MGNEIRSEEIAPFFFSMGFSFLAFMGLLLVAMFFPFLGMDAIMSESGKAYILGGIAGGIWGIRVGIRKGARKSRLFGYWMLSMAILTLPLLSSKISGGSTRPSSRDAKVSTVTISNEQKALAIVSIKQYPEVRDAAILQTSEIVNLTILVQYGTSKRRARQLGDNFVRLVKTFSELNKPGKKIGRGTLYYWITVHLPNEEKIVDGTKSRTSEMISW